MADQVAIVAEVEAAYRHYVDVFNGRDATAISALYDRPHAQVIGEIGLALVNDDADQQGWHDFVFAYLDGQGWGRTEIDEVWITPMTPTLAQVVADVTRYDKGSARMEQVRAHYLLRSREDGWKVVLTLPLVEDGFGPSVG